MIIKEKYDFRIMDSEEVDYLYQNWKLNHCFMLFADGTIKEIDEEITLDRMGTHYNSGGEFVTIDLKTDELMDTINLMKKSSKDIISIDIAGKVKIVVEIYSLENGDDLNIAIELKDSENFILEAANCSYNDNAELESALDYIRACAMDNLIR